MKRSFTPKTIGFTLIELLIVVAIIAILAAIAVPNFLEAQTRSKVSRAKSDMRSLATAVESYYVDNNKYPFTLPFAADLDGYGNVRASDMLTIPDAITTPIAYITSHIPDVFKNGRNVDGPGTGSSFGQSFNSGDPQDQTFMWLNMGQAGPEPGDPGLGFGFFSTAAAWNEHFDQWGWWQMRSVGPTGYYPGSANYPGAAFATINAIYDPTNGTVSLGQVIRNQKSAEGNQSL